MNINVFFSCKKELYALILQYIDNDEEKNDEYFFNEIKNYLEKNEIRENKKELNMLLDVVAKIANNHHRNRNFFYKLEQIIEYLGMKIKQTFSNDEIFEIFKKNKRILYFLFQKEILYIDRNISKRIDPNYFQLENQLLLPTNRRLKSNISEEYTSKRKLGENDTYLCQLIRTDSVREFISYLNQTNLSINRQIDDSYFETNCLLLKKRPKLIEYAAFFGSIQIFQYLKINEAELNDSLWIYAIHSKNPDIIHILEEILNMPNDLFLDVYKETVKCHHNDIADYLYNKYFTGRENVVFGFPFLYHNYELIPVDINNHNCFDFFKYLIKGQFFDLVDEILKSDLANHLFEGDHENPLFLLAEVNKADFIYTLLLKQKEIVSRTFSDCHNLTSIKIPSNITTIGSHAFFNCSSLVKVEICGSIQKIERFTFFGCSSLKEVSIPPSVTYIGESAFRQCSSLFQIEIPPSVTKIEKSAFYGCKKLIKVSIPSSVKSIGDFAFDECNCLRFIFIPSATTYDYLGLDSYTTITKT